jgi:hypothetical protein
MVSRVALMRISTAQRTHKEKLGILHPANGHPPYPGNPRFLYLHIRILAYLPTARTCSGAASPNGTIPGAG